MEQNDKISLLLDMHEHPENYSDEQLAALLDDEMQEHLAIAKRAMTDIPVPDVDAEWQRFEQTHFAPVNNHRWLKVAAIFLGVIMLSVFTYAAIQAVRNNTIDNTVETSEEVATTSQTESAEADTRLGVTDTVSVPSEPVTFDNVALEAIISDIASRHQLQVEFRNEDARALRFYFVWQPDEDLDAVLERLNLFESVNITKEGNTIVVE